MYCLSFSFLEIGITVLSGQVIFSAKKRSQIWRTSVKKYQVCIKFVIRQYVHDEICMTVWNEKNCRESYINLFIPVTQDIFSVHIFFINIVMDVFL